MKSTYKKTQVFLRWWLADPSWNRFYFKLLEWRQFKATFKVSRSFALLSKCSSRKVKIWQSAKNYNWEFCWVIRNLCRTYRKISHWKVRYAPGLNIQGKTKVWFKKIFQAERRRVDHLSSMFLPENIVKKIRNSEPVEPVLYEKGWNTQI